MKLQSVNTKVSYAMMHLSRNGHNSLTKHLTPTHKVKVKVKLSLCLTKHHAMKAYWGSGGIVPRILDLGTTWMSGQLHAPAALPPGKEPLVSIG
jgi:hypothetical protein